MSYQHHSAGRQSSGLPLYTLLSHRFVSGHKYNKQCSPKGNLLHCLLCWPTLLCCLCNKYRLQQSTKQLDLNAQARQNPKSQGLSNKLRSANGMPFKRAEVSKSRGGGSRVQRDQKNVRHSLLKRKYGNIVRVQTHKSGNRCVESGRVGSAGSRGEPDQAWHVTAMGSYGKALPGGVQVVLCHQLNFLPSVRPLKQISNS